MKFLKTKIIYLIICIVAISTVVSVGASLNISITMIEKRGQLVEARTADANSVPATGKKLETVDISKTEKYPVFINGSIQKAFDYYCTEDKKAFIPFDSLLSQLGSELKLYNPDDTVEAKVNNKLLDIYLQTTQVVYNKVPYNLDLPSIASENHILVSRNILNLPEGFTINDGKGKDGVFINYWLSSRTKDYKKNYLFVLSNGIPKIDGLLDGSSSTFTDKGLEKLDVAIYCPDISSYLLKSGDKTWCLNSDNFKKPVLLNIPAQYEVSAGGKYLYWMDDTKDFINIYDITNGTTKKVRNIIEDSMSGALNKYNEMKLKDYKTGRLYERLDFQETSGTSTYTILKRRNKIVAEGGSIYSPDGSRIMFYDNVKGYFVIDGDGTDSISLNNAEKAAWIDNDRIELTSENGMWIFSRSKRNFTKVDQEERYIGQTSSGVVFFQKGRSVFTSSGYIHKELFNIPWQMDYINAHSTKGPFYAVSVNSGSIIGIWGDKRMYLGTPDKFINKAEPDAAEIAFEKNAAISSDGKQIALFQNGDKFITVNIASFKNMKVDKVMLDYTVDNTVESSNLRIKWLDGNCILVYNDRQGWVLDIKNGIHIFRWQNNDSKSTIADFF
jgi:hypothetical protein